MRNDAKPRHEPNPPENFDEGLAATMPRARSKGVGLVKVSALLTLMAATCWVVASLVSVWLVPPYLIVMAFILFPSTATIRRRLEANRLELAATSASTCADRGRPSGEGEGSESEGLGSSERSSTLNGGLPKRETAAIADEENGSAPAITRPKRGRSRPRKVTRPVAEATEVVPATWVEVGPGKFVRAELPTTFAPVAEPHTAVESTPERLPFLDDPIARGSESLEIQSEPAGSIAVAEPGPSLECDTNLRLESRIRSDHVYPNDNPIATGLNQVIHRAALEALVLSAQSLAQEKIVQEPDLNASTVDGITLQVADDELPILDSNPFFELVETDFEPNFDRDSLWPPTEPVEPSGSTELDPGETTCDGLVDRATPLGTFDGQVEARTGIRVRRDLEAVVGSPQDNDPGDPEDYVERETSPGVLDTCQDDPDAGLTSTDVYCGGRGLRRSFSPKLVGRRIRGGLDRVLGGRAPQGRSGRFTRSNRRSTNPRRPSRRTVGRPRQITRTSPPRSPP